MPCGRCRRNTHHHMLGPPCRPPPAAAVLAPHPPTPTPTFHPPTPSCSGWHHVETFGEEERGMTGRPVKVPILFPKPCPQAILDDIADVSPPWEPAKEHGQRAGWPIGWQRSSVLGCCKALCIPAGASAPAGPGGGLCRHGRWLLQDPGRPARPKRGRAGGGRASERFCVHQAGTSLVPAPPGWGSFLNKERPRCPSWLRSGRWTWRLWRRAWCAPPWA